jgi:hypothetical protein
MLSIAIVMSIFVVILLLFSSMAYTLWIKNGVIVPFAVSLIIAIYVITNFFGGLSSCIINGFGKIKLQVFFINFTLIINLPLAIFLGRQFGVIGVILPSVFFNIVASAVYTYQANRLLNQVATGIWNK